MMYAAQAEGKMAETLMQTATQEEDEADKHSVAGAAFAHHACMHAIASTRT